eukprot:Awhi_evm2s13901
MTHGERENELEVYQDNENLETSERVKYKVPSIQETIPKARLVVDDSEDFDFCENKNEVSEHESDFDEDEDEDDKSNTNVADESSKSVTNKNQPRKVQF